MADNNVTIIGPSVGPNYAQVTVSTPGGEMRVAAEPTKIFYNSFDTGLNASFWTATAGGGGVAPTSQVGQSNIGTGTTANGFSYLVSVPTFQPVPPGWLEYANAMNLPSPYVANSYFWIGPGNHATTPTTAAPLTDGAGFEVAVGGKMFAVCWSGSVRNQIADLSAATGTNKQPTDGNVHIYYVYYRGDNIFWAIDSRDNIVASIPNGSLGPVVNTLPILLMAIAGAVAPLSSAVLIDNLSYVADTTNSANQLADATLPWQKVAVDATGNLQVKEITTSVQTTLIAAGAVANTVIKASAGVFYGFILSTSAAGTPVAFDNATTNTGTPVGALPASAAIGTYPSVSKGVGCVNGITISGGATNPAMTILWS